MSRIFFLTLLILNLPISTNAQEDFKLSDLDSLNNKKDKIRSLITAGKTVKGEGKLRLIAEELLSKSTEDSSSLSFAYGNYYYGNYYYKNNQFKKAQEFFQSAYETFIVLENKEGQAESAFSLASIYFYIDQYRAALNYAEKALDLYYTTENETQQANTMALMCDIYTYMEQYSMAIQYCAQALQLKEDQNTTTDKEIILNTIGLIYQQLGSYKKAEDYLRDALKIALINNEPYNLATTYSNLGSFFLEKNQFDSAYKYFNQALSIDQKAQDQVGLAYSYYDLANFFLKTGQKTKAYNYLNQTADIAKKLSLKDLLGSVNVLVSEYYIQIDSTEKAIKLLKNSLVEADKMHSSPHLIELYKKLAKVYYKIGDTENALIYAQLHAEKSAEQHKAENVKTIAEIETLYKLEKKEKEIDLLLKEQEIKQLENERSFTYIIFLGIAIALLIIIILILVNRNRLKNRVNKKLEKQNHAIELQKEEISAQNEDLEDKRRQLEDRNNQITDSIVYARHIQSSLLPQKNDLKLLLPRTFVFYRPKDIVSGDFFWFGKVHDKIAVAAIDCTGHGVPGSFMTVLANSLLKQIILESKITSPDLVISLLDQKIQQNMHHDKSKIMPAEGMDMALIFIDEDEKKVEFCGAKSPLYLVKENGSDTFVGNRYSVGGSERLEKSFTKTSISITEKTFLYLGSDGYQDQFGGPDNKKYMKKSFRRLIQSLYNKSINEQQTIIEDEFLNWKSGYDQTDDVLLIGIELNPNH